MLVIALLACAIGAKGAAAVPHAYGKHFVRLDQPPPGSLSAVAPETDGSLADAQRHLERLEAVELREGPYADALAEPLATLARGYRQAGDYRQALATYRRTLHIVRVNDGLYSERQIPLLREMLLTYREAGDLVGLDGQYDYFFRVYGMGRAPYTPLRLRAALEYLQWQREALLSGIPGNPERHLLDLVALNESLVDAVIADPDAPFSWQRGLVLSQVANLYLLQDQFEPAIDETFPWGGRELLNSQPLSAGLDDQRMNNSLRTAHARGRTLLEALLACLPAGQTVDRASVLLALADWHFWNGSRQRAGHAYGEVVKILQLAGETGLLDDWLGEPAELPDNGAFLPSTPTNHLGPQVRARFDVSVMGRVTVIEAEALTPQAASALPGFRRQLAATLFRPRWSGGDAVAVEGLQRDYRLLE